MNIKQKTEELEQTFQNMGWDTSHFEKERNELRRMIKNYCEKNGIKEVTNERRV